MTAPAAIFLPLSVVMSLSPISLMPSPRIGNASSFDYDKTLVVYDDPAQKYEADLIVSALGRGSAMLNDGNYLYDGEFLVIVGADWSAPSTSAAASSSSAAA